MPVKPLARAKSRLAARLSPSERIVLMGHLIDRGVRAARAVAPVSVVTADPVVAARIRALGAEIIEEFEVAGLDAAARLARRRLRRAGEAMMLILAADLPDVTAEALAAMADRARSGAIVVAPSRDGGTNALALPTIADFRFAYGQDSFERHGREARRLGLDVIAHESAALSLDIDRPEHLRGYRRLCAA